MLCSVFRFMISSAADSGKLIGPVARWHLARCGGCRQFHRSCRTLGEALRSEAIVLSGASGSLTGPILAGLSRARRRPVRPLWTAVAAAACVAMAAWIVAVGRRAESPMSPVPAAYAIATPRIELPVTWPHVFEAPLLTEARNLSHSAQSGIRFLVSCLTVASPERVESPLLGESTPPPVQ